MPDSLLGPRAQVGEPRNSRSYVGRRSPLLASLHPMGENLRDAVEEKGQQPGVVLISASGSCSPPE